VSERKRQERQALVTVADVVQVQNLEGAKDERESSAQAQRIRVKGKALKL